MNDGANVLHQNRDGETTLMYALNCSNKNWKSNVRDFIEIWWWSDCPWSLGYTVIHRAVLKRSADVLRDLLSLGVSLMMSGGSSVPCSLYLCDFKMLDIFWFINDANVDLILLHPDCLPEHGVDFYLLRTFFYMNLILDIHLVFSNDKGFQKGTRCYRWLDLRSCYSPGLAYVNVEIEDIYEVNRKCSFSEEDIDQVGKLADYINNERIERILYQTLLW